MIFKIIDADLADEEMIIRSDLRTIFFTKVLEKIPQQIKMKFKLKKKGKKGKKENIRDLVDLSNKTSLSVTVLFTKDSIQSPLKPSLTEQRRVKELESIIVFFHRQLGSLTMLRTSRLYQSLTTPIDFY